LITLHPNWGLRRTVTPKGYVILTRPGHPLANAYGRVSEHRFVAWEAGLLTDPSLHVHHKDENKSNNAIENLEVLTDSEHKSLHRRAKARGTHCKWGHELTPETIYVDKRGTCRCRVCKLERDRLRYDRIRVRAKRP
jgi:hypothetical protein